MNFSITPEREAQIQFYKPLYKELCDLGAPPQVLKAGEKKPAFGSVAASLVRDEEHACEMLRKGYNLGRVAYLAALPGHNPHGIEVIDLDSDDHGLDLAPFTGLMTRRTGESARHHLWFLRPNPHLPRTGSRKGSKLNPDGAYEVMPWNSVLPGSIHPNGSIYELYVWKNGLWTLWDGQEPLTLLDRLPLIDPDPYRPVKAGKIIDFTSNPKKNEKFFTNSDCLEDRKRSARQYIRGLIGRGFVSRSGYGGRSTLAKVASHLMAFHCLPIETALEYLTEPLYDIGRKRNSIRVKASVDGDGCAVTPIWNHKSWNDLCVNGKTGEAYPWSKTELVEALTWGAHSVPAWGVVLFEREERRQYVKSSLDHFIAFLGDFSKRCAPDHHVQSTTIIELFHGFYGIGEDGCTRQRFGKSINRAIAASRVSFKRTLRTKKHTVHYLGLSADGMSQAFITWCGANPLPIKPDCMTRQPNLARSA